MGSVVVQNVTRQFGPQVVLEDVSFQVHTGEMVGLVGANGSGKTTLFRLVTGAEEPDLGTVTRSRGLAVGMLAQEPALDSERTLRDEVGRAFAELLDLEHRMGEVGHRIAEHHDDPRLPELMAEYDRLNARFEAGGGYRLQTRLNEILGGLGFSQADHHLPVSALSGGQKCRAALAQLLVQERRLLLLDEPTNHLDIEATRWLEKFLAGHHGGAVIISHDRFLLDRLATKIIEVERRRVSVFPGNYSNYVRVKETRRLALERQFEKDQAFIAKERAFIAKHISTQRTKEARGRRTRLERRIRAGEFAEAVPGRKQRVSFSFRPAADTARQVLRCEGLTKRYGEKTLFEGLNLELLAADRLGITGPNGTGKTTLLRMIMGEVSADAGHLDFFERRQAGYYGQEHAELDPDRRLIDEVASARPDLSEQELRSFLGRFLFTGEDVFKPLRALSGGEQSRVRLARLVLTAPGVLVLDEPTNHLDIPSREVLEEALDEYTGTLIVVSHDRYFLDRVVDRLLVIESTGHRLYSGGYSHYLQQVEEQREAEARARQIRKQQRRTAQTTQHPGSTRKEPSLYDSWSINKIEMRIMAREEEVAAIQDRFADQAVYRDPAALQRLQAELESATAELRDLNSVWEERIEEQSNS